MPKTYLIFLVLVNLFLLLLNIPTGDSSPSVIGLVSFYFVALFMLAWTLLLFLKIFSKSKSWSEIAVLTTSLLFFSLAFYWDGLTFKLMDFKSLKEISIWYRLGPSLSFTFALLISLNFWFYSSYGEKLGKPGKETN